MLSSARRQLPLFVSRRLPRCSRIAGSSSKKAVARSFYAGSNRSIPSTSTPESESESAEPLDPALPARPTWSVRALLDSFPTPELSDETLAKLYRLSALRMPDRGSAELEKMRRELGEMIRLVEAVRSVDTSSLKDEDEGGIPDGRIWPEGEGMPLSSNTREVEFDDPEIESGHELLKHAQKTHDGFYVVESDRRRK